MKPLKQWICDVCGEVIKSPKDCYVVWGHNRDGNIDKMLILHKNYKDSSGEKGGCFCDERNYTSSLPVGELIGSDGIVRLLSYIDPGKYHCHEYKDNIADMRLFIEIFRRLHIPYYEEARLYWDRAAADGYFDGANEVWMYSPENLKRLIEIYKNEE